MKTYYIPLLAVIMLTACQNSGPAVHAPAPSIFEFSNTINPEGLRADLTYLSSDELKGRDTGSEGLKTAAEFISNRYERMGLKAVGDSGSYYQYVGLEYSTLGSVQYILSGADGEIVDQSVFSKEESGPFTILLGGGRVAEGGILFAGYGARSPEVDQLPADPEGRWILAFYEQGITNFSAIRDLMNEYESPGAIMIMDTDPAMYQKQVEDMRAGLEIAVRPELSYLKEEEGNDYAQVVNSIDPEWAARLLGLNGLEELRELGASIKADAANFTPYELDYSLQHIPEVLNVETRSRNVLGLIEGSDPELKKEVVVLSAHYDHVGIDQPDSTGDAIYNGADDDGSGTVGLMHIAQALVAAKKAGAGPARSVLILHVTAEEKGLLGSRFYSDHPVIDIENTIANLNADMIGRRDTEHPNDSTYIYTIGGKIISSDMDSLLRRANQMSVNLTLNDRYNDLTDRNQLYRRSDHWNFGRLGVPFVFFFSGLHEDYHRPSDEVDKIDFGALTKRTQLIYMTTALLANTEERPVVDSQEFIDITRRQPR